VSIMVKENRFFKFMRAKLVFAPIIAAIDDAGNAINLSFRPPRVVFFGFMSFPRFHSSIRPPNGFAGTGSKDVPSLLLLLQ
jgi:hypothetical protein